MTEGPHPDEVVNPIVDGILDEVVDDFITAARALVGIAVRSINAAPVEITLMQHRVLVLLASRGEQTVSALAGDLGVNASNGSRVCDRLQRLGLVARRRSVSDARSVCISITGEGRQVLQAVHAHRRTEVRGVLADLPAATVHNAVDALRQFNDAAHETGKGYWASAGQPSEPSTESSAESSAESK